MSGLFFRRRSTMLHALTLLGTKGGPAIDPGGPNPTYTLLILSGHRIVIDCGLGVARVWSRPDGR